MNGRLQVTRIGPALGLALGVALVSPEARSLEPDTSSPLPPWTDAGDIPIPAWAKSVAPNRSDAALYVEPGNLDVRRGSAQLGAHLPLFATRRAAGCTGRWLNVGPLAWICSDVADYAADDPGTTSPGTHRWTLPDGSDALQPLRPGARPMPPLEPTSPTDDGLPYRYYFAGQDGANGFANLANALDDAPDQELEKGFAVAAIDEKKAHGESWIRTKKGRWIAVRELVPARSFLFHGELVADGKLDVAWVVADRANVFANERAQQAAGTRTRFEKLKVLEQNEKLGMVRIATDATAPAWMRARDLAIPRLVAPPPEATRGAPDERWIDVDLAQQALVAYEGTRPVFATLVSTGRGPRGEGAATPTGTHRVWVKIFTTKMDNLDKDDVEHHYAIEDVPWVQFFDKAVALHGAFWHRDFGHVHSHGCVNLAPIDARWLFAFTGPHLPRGWTAAFPTPIEPGTFVRVR